MLIFSQLRNKMFVISEEMMADIKTQRLLLRHWREEDLEPFAELNQDPRVMEYFPAPLTREESDDFARKIMAEWEKRGWGLWAVSVPDLAEFIGFIGLSVPNFEAAFMPTVEIGWRLSSLFWNQGYATEGALAVLEYGFNKIGLDEVVSFTAMTNMRSRKVMEKIGLHRAIGEDFEHPKLPIGHPLRRHVLYRLKKEQWNNTKLQK